MKGLAAILIWLGVFSGLVANAQPDCELCRRQVGQLDQIRQKKTKNVELLGKNNAYLAHLSAKEASKFLKVESNRILILKVLDGLKAEEEKLREEIKKGLCLKCYGKSGE